MKIKEINMKETVGNSIYYRMTVAAYQLPEWIYTKAEKIDEEYSYLENKYKEYFELEGYISDNKVKDLKVVYYWDDYETIAIFNEEEEYKYIYDAFVEFANKYGEYLPDNSKLHLGDGEYEDIIPIEIKKEWNSL